MLDTGWSSFVGRLLPSVSLLHKHTHTHLPRWSWLYTLVFVAAPVDETVVTSGAACEGEIYSQSGSFPPQQWWIFPQVQKVPPKIPELAIPVSLSLIPPVINLPGGVAGAEERDERGAETAAHSQACLYLKPPANAGS